MAKRTMTPGEGTYTVEVEFPGEPAWVGEVHDAIDKWTLDLASEGPADSLVIFPSFEIVETLSQKLQALKLTWVEHPADSAWDAANKAMEFLEEFAPDLPSRTWRLNISVGPEKVATKEWVVDVP